jgi:hypothetical protein
LRCPAPLRDVTPLRHFGRCEMSRRSARALARADAGRSAYRLKS